MAKSKVITSVIIDKKTSLQLSNTAAQFQSTMTTALKHQAEIVWTYLTIIFAIMSKHGHNQDVAMTLRDRIVSDFAGKKYIGGLVVNMYKACCDGGRFRRLGLVKATQSKMSPSDKTGEVTIGALYALIPLFYGSNISKCTDKQVLAGWNLAASGASDKEIRAYVNKVLGKGDGNGSSDKDPYKSRIGGLAKVMKDEGMSFDQFSSFIGGTFVAALGKATFKKYVGKLMNDL
jgi:hypothetical protein